MKKYIFSLFIFTLSFIALQAQNNNAGKTAWLHGKWVVENKALLPKHERKDMKEFLKDTLVFSPDANIFSNHTYGTPTDVYSYDEATKTLLIMNARELDGVEYEIVSFTEKRLVFKVLNAQKNDFIELVYTKL